MARGRKQDLTIPATRALTQQRDYRARRTQYVHDLEDKCRTLESENERLRQEVLAMRLTLPAITVHNPQVIESSSQLMRDLTTASESLSRFQHLLFAEANTFPPPIPVPSPPEPSDAPISRYSIPSPESVGSPLQTRLSSERNPSLTSLRFPRDILNDNIRVGSQSPLYEESNFQTAENDSSKSAPVR